MSDKHLDRIKALVSEHYPEYLIVVCPKDGEIFSAYSSTMVAHSMAKLVIQDIKEDWSRSRENNSNA